MLQPAQTPATAGPGRNAPATTPASRGHVRTIQQLSQSAQQQQQPQQNGVGVSSMNTQPPSDFQRPLWNVSEFHTSMLHLLIQSLIPY